jgi:uncharacterized protein YkwD
MSIKWPKDGHFSRKRYIEVFLVLVLFYFILAYSVVNRDTISEQIDIITQGSSFFAKTATYSVLKLENDKVGFDHQTYEIELIIFEEINKIRLESGLEPLSWDPMLSKLAREHSLDMARYGYFNHTDLFGLDPTQRAEELGINTKVIVNGKSYDTVGENIGFMPRGIVKDVGVLLTTKDIASGMVFEWMLSEPHKDNILNTEYLSTGIGVAYNGDNSYYLTQNFQ